MNYWTRQPPITIGVQPSHTPGANSVMTRRGFSHVSASGKRARRLACIGVSDFVV